jgi:diacylglycerol kinase family enzyme
MYLYIYDNFLTEKKYQNQLYKIENRLVDLGIKGRVVRLNILKNMAEVVEDGIKQGVKTVVVVGNDVSFSKIINIVANKNVVLGIIPVNNKSKIAKILGIPPLGAACEVLAQRIIKSIDLGMAGNYFFIDSAIISNEETSIQFPTYTIKTPKSHNVVSFNNLGIFTNSERTNFNFNPTDNKLELVINANKDTFKKEGDLTVIPFKEVEVSCAKPGAFVIVDQVTKLKPPITITVEPNKLKTIVGSKRLFE